MTEPLSSTQYSASLPVAAVTPLDLELTPSEIAFIRRWRQARNEITSPFEQRVITLVVRAKGRVCTWFVGGREENFRADGDGS